MTYSCIIYEPRSDVQFLCVGNLPGVHHLVPRDHHLGAVLLVEGARVREEGRGHQDVARQPAFGCLASLRRIRSKFFYYLHIYIYTHIHTHPRIHI